ncbi:alpha/beta fold hydrolase [Natronosalvus rutilus]|uniref:Alpha/beta hydrolase n=1 Tax=Natronosalvus rutilus TaxID=2953753 RepID=A0A9E7NEV8_9EURY|nr:alpha/beta hydrolase [Natronosalvus rutilus]UTF55714.1 alpha/beta hydrolase [Natronosalvus rutilus]
MYSDWQSLIEEGTYVEVDGTDVHHFDLGEGHPLLLIHGGGLSSSAEMNWGAVLEGFAEQFRVIALDQPGFGFTDPRGEVDYYPAERAKFIIKFIEELGLDSVSVMGNSEGATISCHMALRRPNLVNHVIPVNGGMTIREFGTPAPSTKTNKPTIEDVREEVKKFREHYFTETKYHPFWREITDEKIERLYEIEQRNWEYNNKRDEVIRGTAHLYNKTLAYEGIPISRQPENFELPVLLPWSTNPFFSLGQYDDPGHDRGGEDPHEPLDDAYEFYKQLDDAQMHIWSDSKHHVQTDKAPEFIEVVTSFVQT